MATREIALPHAPTAHVAEATGVWSWLTTVSLRAFMASGRSMVRVAIPSSTDVRTRRKAKLRPSLP